jgi:hypothetical protein
LHAGGPDVHGIHHLQSLVNDVALRCLEDSAPPSPRSPGPSVTGDPENGGDETSSQQHDMPPHLFSTHHSDK